MDCRITLDKDETFIAMLRASMNDKQKVAILFDEEGLSRAEGFIKLLETNVPQPYIELDNGVRIKCSSIAAVNGIFLDKYSEC